MSGSFKYSGLNSYLYKANLGHFGPSAGHLCSTYVFRLEQT